MVITEKSLKQELAGAEKWDILQYLMYQYYDNGLFIMEDGSTGFVWELTPVACDGLSETQLEEISTQLERAIAVLPEECAVQFILSSDDHIETKLKSYADHITNKTGLAGQYHLNKINRIKEGKDKFFSNENETFYAKRIQVFFTFRSWIKAAQPTVKEMFVYYFTGENPTEERFYKEFRRGKERLTKLKDGLQTRFKAAGVVTKEVGLDEFMRYLRGFLNPGLGAEISTDTIRKEVPLKEQLFKREPIVIPHGQGLYLNGRATKVVSMVELAESPLTGILTKEVVIGKRFSFVDLVKNMTMVVNIWKDKQNKEKQFIERKENTAGKFSLKSNTAAGGEEVATSIIRRDAVETMKRQYENNLSYTRVSVHFVIQGEDEKVVDSHVDDVLISLNRVGFEGLPEETIGHRIILQCLPLGFHPLVDRLTQTIRSHFVVSDGLAKMLPLYGTWAGTQDQAPNLAYLNRRGQITYLDLWELTDSAPHTIIAGVTGSGKSFFTNDVLMQYMRLGARFIILDKGDSYKKICELNNGQYNIIDLKNPITINPFRHALDEEQMAFQVSLMAEMASGGDPDEKIGREDRSIISSAIKEAYHARPDQKIETTLSDVVAVIGKEGEKGKILARKMSMFLRGNQYGKFFDGQNEFDIDNPFTVFELNALSRYKDLSSVFLMNIMYHTTNFVARLDLRDTKKFFIIEEAWQFLNSAESSIFLEEAARTYRKYGCAVVTISQQITEFNRTAGGKALLSNSPNRILLHQPAEVVAGLKDELKFSDAAIEMLKTVETRKGFYSEAFVQGPKGTGVIRYLPDPFGYWISTTDPKDNAYLAKKLEETKDIIEAINQIIKEGHLYGIR